jgi:S1-C subfamily serine protease
MQKIISLIIVLVTLSSNAGLPLEPNDRGLTRAQYAEIIHASVAETALPVINNIAENGIYDVTRRDSCYNSVYALYRAGVLEGSDIYGGFHPNELISEEAAAVIDQRLRNPAERVQFSMPASIPAAEIFAEYSGAVISIDTFDENDRYIRSGTAFFISPDGTALTLPHVLEGAKRVEATLPDGGKTDMTALDPTAGEARIAVMRFQVSDTKFFKLGSSDLVREGDEIYVISNPLEFTNSMTSGIIAKAVRVVDEETFIQFSAPISFGSGGGPLINTLGQVVGIASSSFTAGQNLNLAVPITDTYPINPI